MSTGRSVKSVSEGPRSQMVHLVHVGEIRVVANVSSNVLEPLAFENVADVAGATTALVVETVDGISVNQ